MPRKVIWSEQAHRDRIKILNFWIQHNHSSTYSRKLNALIMESLRLIAKYPQIGRLTDFDGVRVRPIRNYLMFYRITKRTIEVISIWDCRQEKP